MRDKKLTGGSFTPNFLGFEQRWEYMNTQKY